MERTRTVLRSTVEMLPPSLRATRALSAAYLVLVGRERAEHSSLSLAGTIPRMLAVSQRSPRRRTVVGRSFAACPISVGDSRSHSVGGDDTIFYQPVNRQERAGFGIEAASSGAYAASSRTVAFFFVIHHGITTEAMETKFIKA